MSEINFEKGPPREESVAEKISPEYVLYHNAIHLNVRKGELIDFFAPKSEATQTGNRTFKKLLEEVPEVQSLIKSDKFQEVKNLLIDNNDFRYYDERREKIVNKLRDLFEKEKLSALKKLVSGDIWDVDLFHLRDLIMNQLGTENNPIDMSKIKMVYELRQSSYYLTKEDDSFRGWDLVVFDIRKLLRYGFEIYEANLEIVDRLAGEFVVRDVVKYIDSFKKINSPKDCLKYSVGFREDYDACRTEVIYKPYCPEYLIQPPTTSAIAQLAKRGELVKIFNKYKRRGVEEPWTFDLNEPDPNDIENYHFIVNLLFTDSIVDIKTKY